PVEIVNDMLVTRRMRPGRRSRIRPKRQRSAEVGAVIGVQSLADAVDGDHIDAGLGAQPV
ncbi:hypothetical protein LTR66_017910, partial [Elasticomyces elasticus]